MRKLRNFFAGRLFPCALLFLLVLVAGAVLAVTIPRILAPLAALERIFAAAVAIAVVRSDALPAVKESKLVLILLLPWTGSFLCLLMRDPPRTPLPAPLRTGKTLPEQLGALIGDADAGTCGAASAQYFPVGKEMRLRLLGDIKRAKKCIFLEYYIVAEGVFLRELVTLLRVKASEGVDVRLIADGFGCSLTLPKRARKRLTEAGIAVCVFRPVRLCGFNRRDHRKIAVIDGEIAYTGGMNLADEYVGEEIRFGNWKDTAVRVTGGAAERFYRLFCATWNRLSPENPLPMSEVSPSESGIPCAVFSDTDSAKDPRTGVRVLTKLFSSATHSLYLNTPYLALDKTLFNLLETAAGAGTDVRVMIPHIPDKKTVFLLTRDYARRLGRAGVKVREYTAGFLHAKSAVIDGKYALVSSYNLDYRSLYVQAECGVFLEDEALSGEMERDFLSCWELGTELPPQKFWEKPICSILRLFAPLV